jgi:hypothetical protein
VGHWSLTFPSGHLLAFLVRRRGTQLQRPAGERSKRRNSNSIPCRAREGRRGPSSRVRIRTPFSAARGRAVGDHQVEFEIERHSPPRDGASSRIANWGSNSNSIPCRAREGRRGHQVGFRIQMSELTPSASGTVWPAAPAAFRLGRAASNFLRRRSASRSLLRSDRALGNSSLCPGEGCQSSLVWVQKQVLRVVPVDVRRFTVGDDQEAACAARCV